jgi:photoactive yellow protein
MDTAAPDIDTPDLARRLSAMTPEAIDALAFGAIRLDAGGTVTFYSARERANSGLRREVVGRNFFADIAPCMQRPEVSGRIERARASGTLDVAFDFVSDLPSGERDVALRARLLSTGDGGTWILLQRED